jgi:hypothetical protein
MILAFVDVAEEEAAAASKAEAGRSLSRTGSAGGISAGLAVVLAGGESRPVRRVLSRNRRTNTHRTPPSHPIAPRPHTPLAPALTRHRTPPTHPIGPRPHTPREPC